MRRRAQRKRGHTLSLGRAPSAATVGGTAGAGRRGAAAEAEFDAGFALATGAVRHLAVAHGWVRRVGLDIGEARGVNVELDDG